MRGFINLANAREPIGILRPFVPPDSFDPREPQGKTAFMTCAALDLITGNFQNDSRLHSENPAI